MKILYCDYFHKSNSNFFWRDSFARYGEVTTIHLNISSYSALLHSLKQLDNIQFDFDHIHFGGSTKRVPASTFKLIRSKTKAPITIFYGDAYNNTANQIAALPFVDAVYLTNDSHLVEYDKAKFILCPYDDSVFNDRSFKESKQKDVVFIGNPYSNERAQAILDLSKKFNLEVYGAPGWRKYEVNYMGQVSYANYSSVLSNYKIALGDPAFPPCEHSSIDTKCLKGMNQFYQNGLCRNDSCPNFSPMAGYFSNRLANTIASRILHCVHYVPGMEKIFVNHSDIVWVNDHDELEQQIRYYLKNNSEREQVALQGYKKIQQYTFNNVVDRIVRENSEYTSI